MVIKRNGKLVKFDKTKIENAVQKAFIEVDGELFETDTPSTIANELEEIYMYHNAIGDVSVETIQDWVEHSLMQSERPDVAKSYICYRYLHNLARDRYADLMKEVHAKLSGKKIENQNANVDEHSFGGRTGEANRVLTKHIAVEETISPMARKNHEENMIYIHDLDNYTVGMHNCLSIPFDKLLSEGFNTRQVDIRPANCANTAFQLIAVVFQLQSLQQFGGVSATHLDWTMVPYVRKSFWKHFKDGLKYIEGFDFAEDLEFSPDRSINHIKYAFHDKAYQYALDLTEREVRQGAEGLYHNLNSLQSRSGNQLPFTSINYGTCTLPEGRMVIKALLDVSIEGLGAKRKTSIFPCGIFQLGNGINKKPGDPNYDLFRLALKSTAQRLYPNYANIDWSGNAGYDPNDPCTYFSTMGK